jgi:hypothetical protein
MVHFLLVYDRSEGQLLHEERYESRVDALHARFVAEAEHRRGPDNIEVVVLSAGSREDLLRTHARYFRSLAELASRTG